MKMTVTKSMFHNQFQRCGRGEQFSYEALNALYDYLEEYEESTGEEIELDVIALCCDYAEDTIANVLANYNLESIEELENETMVIWQDDESILYQQY